MDQTLGGEESLPEEDAAVGEAPLRGVDTASTEHDMVGYTNPKTECSYHTTALT